MTEQHIIKTSTATHTINHRGVEVHMDPEKRPSFANISDDYHLLENLIRYSKFCENFNVPVPQMAQSLARAIGIQNGGKYSVLVYDYLLAIPEYPPTQNGTREALQGEGRYCNMVCYKSQLFGVVVFPASENVTFYFPEFSSYSPYVQQLIFTYGNKILRLCPERRVLAFDFRPEQAIPDQQSQPILLTATLKRKLSQNGGSPPDRSPTDSPADPKMQMNDQPNPEYIQLE